MGAVRTSTTFRKRWGLQLSADDTAFVLIFATVLVGLLVGLSSQRLFGYLKLHHRELWGELGRPHAFLNQSTGATNFLLRGQYRDLNDPRLNRLGTIWKVTVMGFVAALWIALIFLVVGQL